MGAKGKKVSQSPHSHPSSTEGIDTYLCIRPDVLKKIATDDDHMQQHIRSS
jgi:hypothetical protein